MLCKFISVRLDDNKMVGEFKPSQSPSFFRGKKSFRKKEKAIMENIFISSKVATETSSVNLQAFPENNFFLAFRGIYSTTRLFFFEEFIKLFKAEDVEWRDKMSSKFYF